MSVSFRLGRDAKYLAVIDEFPWLLGTSAAEARRTLSSIQAVMEDERDGEPIEDPEVRDTEKLMRHKGEKLRRAGQMVSGWVGGFGLASWGGEVVS